MRKSHQHSNMKQCYLLLAFLASAVAVPVSRREQCARHCAGSHRFQYTPGTTYTYDYETSTTTTIKGTSHDKSQLQMRAQVDIEVVDQCDFSLRLRGVTLKQSDPESPEYLNPMKGGRDFARTVEGQILRFSYQDGRVEELCPSEGAQDWVTNIQRGILSAFQNTMENLDNNERLIETDVSGKCPVEYQSLGRSWRGVLTIRKLKDLNSCTDRHSADTSVQAMPFTRGSTIQSLPLVSGTQECEQTIGNGILQSSSCVEKHVFRPFSKEGGGAITNVRQKLSYATMSKRSFTGNDYRPTKQALLYSHNLEETADANSVTAAEETMRQLCAASAEDISISVPTKFAAFIYRLRKLDYKSLTDFFRRVDGICPQNPKAKKFFTDAIPVVATEGSVKFMVEMIIRQEVPPSEASFWLTSLFFVTNPTSDMIATLTTLLDAGHEQAYLGISSLAYTFCKDHDCSVDPAVRALVDKLMDNLGDNCYNPDEKKILLILKAVGNIGQSYSREKVLERCYLNPQLRTEVRIAATQAFRRFSCDIPRTSFVESYSNKDEGSELRIASYLAAISCPSSSTLQAVKDTLEIEQVNQVGSFVWTHLQALAKSRHPERQDMKEILTSLYFLNKYNSDIRKFSSAHEASVYLDSLESGVHLDTHVVFPTHSYLPHSASFNLTVDIFGHSCNLLQLDGRLEGMEHAMEQFFGPGGYFPQKQVSKLLREKRSISNNKIDRMDREFDVKSKFDEKPYGSLDVKIFGNTLWFKQFEEQEDGQATLNLMDIVSALAEKQEKEFSRSFMFMDTTYSVPMSTGLPLRLSLNGTASVALKLGGKFNVRSLKHVDILAHLEPSAAVEIAGLLTVDAGTVARTGLRISATMHSSTILDSKLEVNNGEVVKAELNMPREKINIVDIQSRLYLVYGADEREQAGHQVEGYHTNVCTPGKMGRVFGVELCTEISLPGGRRQTPMYPMSGHSSVSIYVRKTDPKLSKYTFDASWENKMVNGQTTRQGMISLNTPGSSVDREVTMKFQLVQPEGTFAFDIKTPVTAVGMKAKYANNASLKKLDLSLSVDEKEKFAVRSEFRSVSEKGGVSYFPSLEITVPSKKLLGISGSAHLKHGQKYGGQLTIQELTEKPIVVKGNLDIKGDNRVEGELSLNSYALDTTVKGYAQRGDTLFGKIDADYRLMDSKPYRISISSKVRDLSANSLTKHSGVLNFQASAFPEYDTSVSWETMQTTGHFENTLSISIGDGTRSKVHTINLQEIIRYKGDIYDNSAEVTLKLSYPERNMNYGFTMKHENTLSSLKNLMEVQYAVNRQISTTVDISVRNKRTYVADLSLKYPGRDVKLMAEIGEDKPKDYKGAISIQWQHGQKMSVIGHYQDRGDSSHIKQEASGEIFLPGRSPITFSCSVGAHNSQYSGLAELNVGLEKYRINADYASGSGINHRLSGMLLLGSERYTTEGSLQSVRDKTTGNFEVKLPSRRKVLAKFDVKNSRTLKVGSLETSWDADRDPTKRFGIDGELRAKPTGYDCKFTAQMLKQVIKGSASTSTEGQIFRTLYKSIHSAEVEWLPKERLSLSLSTNVVWDRMKQQVASSLEVVTPFRNYEKLALNLNHAEQNRQWNNDITATIGRGNKCSLSTEGKYSFSSSYPFLEANMKIRTPFHRFESIFVNATHYQDPTEFNNKFQAQWSGGESIKSEVYYANANSIRRGIFKLTTPLSPVQDVSAQVTFDPSVGVLKANGALQAAPHKKYSAILDAHHTFRERRRMCNINFVANTPYRGFEIASSKLTYNNDGTTLNSDIEIMWHRKKVVFGVNGSNKNAFYNKNMEGKIHFTSPFNGFENLQLTSSIQSASGHYKADVDLQAPYTTKASLNTEAKFNSLRDFEVNAVVNGDFSTFRKLSLDVVHKLQNRNMRSTLDTAYNEKQVTVIVTGETKSSYRSRNIEGSISIKSPLKGLESLKMDLNHDQNGEEYTTRLAGSSNSENALLVHKMNVLSALNFESSLHITSSIRAFKQIQASVLQAYNPGHFAHNINIQYGKKEFVIVMQSEDQRPAKEYKIILKTPFEKLRTFELSSVHQFRHAEYESESSVQWNDGNKITVRPRMRNEYRQVIANVEITSNVRGSEIFKTSLKYDMVSHEKKLLVDVEWTQINEKPVLLRGNMLLNPGLLQIDSTLVTPYKGFEKVLMSVKGEHGRQLTYMSVAYERNSRKIDASAKYSIIQGGAQAEVTFTSPFYHARDLRALAKYQVSGDSLTSEIYVQCDPENKIMLTTSVIREEGKLETKLLLNTPFSNIKSASLDTVFDISRKKNVADITLRWNDYLTKLILECETTRGRTGDFRISLESPIENWEKIVTSSHYTIGQGEFEGSLDLDVNRRKGVYKAQVKYTGQQLYISLNSPHQPFRTVELTTTWENDERQYKMQSIFQWEDKDIQVSTFYKKDNNIIEVEGKISTPFQSFHTFKAEGTLKNSIETLDGRLSLVTPFEALPSLETTLQFKRESHEYNVIWTATASSNKISVSGQLVNVPRQSLEASLSVETSYPPLNTVALRTELDYRQGWKDSSVDIELRLPRSLHSFNAGMKDDGGEFRVDVRFLSPIVKTGRTGMALIYDHKDGGNLNLDLTLHFGGKDHNLVLSRKHLNHGFEVELKANCPFLPEQTANLKLTLNHRRRATDAKLLFTVPSSSHQVTLKYEVNKQQVSGSIQVNSKLLSTSPLVIDYSYVNGNNKDLEMSVGFSTASSKHSLVASLKNYEGEKFLQLKMECPNREYSVTGSVKYDGYREADIVLTATVPDGEIRMSGSLKRIRWDHVEAFLTLNTPYEPLQMLRVDSSYKNDDFKNMDVNFQVETSHRHLRKVGFSAKVNRGRGSEDVSLALHLPSGRYRTLQLLGNLHYNPEFSEVDSRLTVTFPPKRYSIYGHYILGDDSSLTADGELEWESKKYTAKGNAQFSGETKGVTASLILPKKGSYGAGGFFSSAYGRHSLSLSYSDPYHRPLNGSITLDYENPSNTNVVLLAQTPFRDYSRVEVRAKHQRDRRNVYSDFEYKVENRRFFLSIFRSLNRTDHIGSIRAGTPFKVLKEGDISWVDSNEGRVRSLEIAYNRQRQLRAAMTASRGSQSYLLDLNVHQKPLTISAKIRPGRDFIIKSNYPTRTMSLNLVHQDSPGLWSQDAVLVWDEAAKKQVSYNFKVSDSKNGKATGKDIMARLNFPARSLELKGKYTKSGRVTSAGIGFHWDADRDNTKHLTAGFEHHDISNRGQTAHKLQLTLTHPNLPKDILQSNLISLSSSEFHLRSELQYSRYQERHVIVELKATELSRDPRDSHYKAELRILHPVSHIDCWTTAELTDNREESMAYLRLYNMDRERRATVHELRTKIQKLRNEIDVLLKAGEKQMSILGKMINDHGAFSMSMVRKWNDRADAQAHFNFNSRLKTIDFNATTAGKRGIHLSASFPDDSATLQITRSRDLRTTTDAYVFVGLEKSRILKSRVHWRPGMWRDLRITTGESLRGMSQAVDEKYEEISAELGSEWQHKWQGIRSDMYDQLKPFIQEMSRELSTLSSELTVARDTLQVMYENNEFYMKDICRSVKKACRTLRELCSAAGEFATIFTDILLQYAEDLYYDLCYGLEDLFIYTQRLFRNLSSSINEVSKRITSAFRSVGETIYWKVTDAIRQFGSTLNDMWRKGVTCLESYVKQYAPCIIDGYYSIRIWSDKIRTSVTGAIASITETITTHPLYVALGDYWVRIVSTVRTFQLADLTSAVQSRVLFMGEKASAFINQLSDSQVIEVMRNKIPVEYVTNAAKATMKKSVEIYTTLGLDKLVRTVIGYSWEYVKREALSSGQDLLHEFYQMKTGAKYEFDQRKGSFYFECTLPTSRNSVYEIFEFAKYPQLKRLSEIKDVLLTKYYEDFCIWDSYYKLVNILSPRNWLPPFMAHAMIAGKQHYVTFDKHAFDFAGECSYLLARDFMDGNFTVVANYQRNKDQVIRKSMTILSEGHKFEIAGDYKVRLDDVNVELPFRSGHTAATREGPNVRLENEKKGFVVVCNFVHDICTMGMSGFYFAKTGGLFGTYDYEPHLDMMTPQKTLATDVESFVNSWEVGQEASCMRTSNLATIPGNDYRVQRKCKALFAESSSNFRACFKQVDPASYENMCVSDLSVADESDHESAICTSAAAYFTECRIAQVQLKMPKACVRCEKKGGKYMHEGDVTKVNRDTTPGMSDVVFVVEEKECNEKNFRYLTKLAQSVEDNLQQKNFLDNRYRVVGFGGDDVHAKPHVHTMSGREYGTVRDVESAFLSLEVGDGPANMLEALRFAASLDFRPGTIKSFILMKCSTCKAEESKAEYGEILRTLLDGDINLHLLMEQKYEMRIANKNSKAKKVIGLDRNFAYTLKDVKDSGLLGDSDLLVQLKLPKDVCVPLALEVNGSTFDAQYLTEFKRNTHKKFMDVFARRLLKSAQQRPSWSMCCECIATTEGVGKSTCQRCVSDQVANMISDGVTTFHSQTPRGGNTEPAARHKHKPRSRKH